MTGNLARSLTKPDPRVDPRSDLTDPGAVVGYLRGVPSVTARLRVTRRRVVAVLVVLALVLLA
ncbi:MAG TPA: hypothetical protein VGP05_06845, partial [Pseudonocardia sp.]|nr:hypothetical protein [Pseudonocardia sp.]